ncbi:hypothetical protein V9T40_005051 [Parthenolecanium corni]|uniref:Fatty acid desaturase domain-containing protein n=1 Tax=Parthenolecanium corni TaxID=536013 RepID=A0AAN9Y3V8_9HEMI
MIVLSQFGSVVGAHRLWSHNSFKAALPLRVFLLFCQTLSGQYSAFQWARLHRVHHKYVDTSKDPYNANAGFFFCHIGWLLIQPTPEAREEAQKVWVEDLRKDKLVMLQHKYYWHITLPISFIIPGIIPWYFWSENFIVSNCVAVYLRWVFWLHATFTINSFAHFYGMKPFDKNIKATDNKITWFATLGDEGWHNYHHVFPWDYKPSEWWGYHNGVGTMFIDFCAQLGLAHDLKTTSPEMSTKRRQRTGDLSCNEKDKTDDAPRIDSCHFFFHYQTLHELSLDKRVRASPYVPPPENEVKMTPAAILKVRVHRIGFVLVHIFAAFGLYYLVRGQVKMQTLVATSVMIVLSQFGSVVGAHRLWSHNSFKAALPLRAFLLFCQTLSAQYSAFQWARLHRVHHKYVDTSKDPYNANAGFFFCHIGWLLIQPTPEAREEAQKVWVEDLKKDKLVMLQHKYYWHIILPISFIIPGIIPWYFWSENFIVSNCVAVYLRWVFWLHATFTINSLAHFYGMKPFDKNIKATDNKITWLATLGDEGWHNYHHVFPWDYKPSEWWGYHNGVGTMFIDFCARLGLAHDLKTTSPEMSTKRRQRTGDLSCHVWGWYDENVSPVDRKFTDIQYKEVCN